MSSSIRTLFGAAAISAIVTIAGAVLVDLTIDGGQSTAPTNIGDGPMLRIEDFAYVPPTLTVGTGQSVAIANQDAANHTVTSGTRSEQDGTFDIDVPADGTAQLTIAATGTYPYICTIHPGMKGTIEVTP
jgi:plastocyanin